MSAVIKTNQQERPTAAELWIDGRDTGTIPGTFSLQAGTHQISARKFGYVLINGPQTVRIKNGQDTIIKFIFVKKLGD